MIEFNYLIMFVLFSHYCWFAQLHVPAVSSATKATYFAQKPLRTFIASWLQTGIFSIPRSV